MTKGLRTFRAAIYFSTGLLIGIITAQLPVVEAATNRILQKPVGVLAKSEIAQSLPEPLKPVDRCYSMGYDTRNKNPAWVYERLTESSLTGNANRDKCRFKEDPVIPSIFRSTLCDYQGSGFDRGHLAPAANHKCSQKDMEDTFYLSNMCPQDQKFNRVYWAKLEKYVRDLTKSYSVIHVFTGPLYLPKTKSNGQKWVKYQVIGKNDVSVPTHFFKILVLEKPPHETIYKGYVLPNEPISSTVSIENFSASIEKIEKASGVIFKR